MIFSKKGERGDEHENSGKDTPCTDMAADNDTAPRVQAGAGIGIYVLMICGGLLLLYDLLLVILRMNSKKLWFQLLAVAGAMLTIPFVAGLLESLLKKAADAIKEFIGS